jgi:hypothetical protein
LKKKKIILPNSLNRLYTDRPVQGTVGLAGGCITCRSSAPIEKRRACPPIEKNPFFSY